MPNFLKQVAAIIGRHAPNVARTIGGPLGGAVADTVLDLLGVDMGKSEEEQLAELATMSDERFAALATLEAQLAGLEHEDRADSRQLAVKHGLTRHFILTLVILGMAILAFGALITAYVTNATVSPTLEPLVFKTLGILEAVFLAVVYWWYGTSFSSQRKGITYNK